MVIRLLLFCSLFIQTLFAAAQINWEWVQGGPTFTSAEIDKIRDITFVDDTVGYLITNTAKVYHTINGGNDWVPVTPLPGLHSNPGYAYNQIEFITHDTGFAMIYLDTILYKTIDGGYSWQQFKVANQWPKPAVLSISKYGQTIFCMFRQSGKTLILDMETVSGNSEIDTAYGFYGAYDYVPCTQSNGIVFGDSSGRGRILYTTDECETWKPALTMSYTNQAWEMQMIDSLTGFALCGRNNTTNKFYFIKTTDGGKSWNGIPGTDTIAAALGGRIFFANENTGWTGNPTAGLLETTDGGATWHFIYEGQEIYCFAKTPSGLVYAAGKNLIRIDSRLLNSLGPSINEANTGKQFSVFPNPVSNYFSIQQNENNSAQQLLIKLYDVLGNKLTEQKTYSTGRISVADLSSGVYKVQITTTDKTELHTIVITHNE